MGCTTCSIGLTELVAAKMCVKMLRVRFLFFGGFFVFFNFSCFFFFSGENFLFFVYSRCTLVYFVPLLACVVSARRFCVLNCSGWYDDFVAIRHPYPWSGGLNSRYFFSSFRDPKLPFAVVCFICSFFRIPVLRIMYRDRPACLSRRTDSRWRQILF